MNLPRVKHRCVWRKPALISQTSQHNHWNPDHAITAGELDKNKIYLLYSVDLSAAFDLLRSEVLERTIGDIVKSASKG